MILVVWLAAVATTSQTKAQTIYLDPSAKYVTTGEGTEFIMELKVDAAVTSLKSFIYYVSFDDTKLDTVEVLEGDLFPSSGGITYFYAFIIDGNELQLEGLIMGAGVDVAGPGTLATIRFRTLDTGTVHMDMVDHRLRDVGADLIPSTANGGTVYVDVPPEPFDLISPIGGQEKSGLPGDLLPLSWTASQSVYPGENIEYTLEYSTSSGFEPGQTTTVPGITGASYQLDVGDLVWGYEGTYYWRVTAIGDIYGWERVCTPVYETFEFAYIHVPPEAFDLLSPAQNAEISGVAEVLYDWEDAITEIPGDVVVYSLYIGPDPGLPTGALVTITTANSEAVIPVAGLPRNEPLYWAVRAFNSYAQSTQSTSTYNITFLGCCIGRVGDANNSGEDEPTIGDVSVIIDLLFISGTPLECWAEGDINQTGGVEPEREDITIGDVSVLIDYLYITGPSLGLAECL